MQPSAMLCRAQEAHHTALARATTLDNVRLIASTAAAAWAKEGVAARMREDRKLRSLAYVQEQALRGEPPATELAWLSENPDRGRAEPDRYAG